MGQERDEPGARVWRIQRRRETAQVTDVAAGRERSADHRPLAGVKTTHLALFGGQGTVGAPRVDADADQDRGSDQLAPVAGQAELDPLGVLGPICANTASKKRSGRGVKRPRVAVWT